MTRMRTGLRSLGCDLWRVTFLRDPYDRLLSDLFYMVWIRSNVWLHHNETVNGERRHWDLFRMLKNEARFDNGILRSILNNYQAGTAEEYPIPLSGHSTVTVQAALDILCTFEY